MSICLCLAVGVTVEWRVALVDTGKFNDARADVEALLRFARAALRSAGCDEASAESVAVALSETSLRGVDSHGIRLLPHYLSVLRTRRINPAPNVTSRRTRSAAAIVDADDGFAHHASFSAIDLGMTIAREHGLAGIATVNSSHFGAAGCYVLRAAQRGLVAFAFCNSDSFVVPHDGTRPFHGTNPIAFAAPVLGARPFLLDMATSVIPWNRVQDAGANVRKLPADVALDEAGRPTSEPADTAALLPLGGRAYGYKGAGLASMIEVLSAVMTGMAFCSRLLPMIGPDQSTPRRLGHFFIVIDPDSFVQRTAFEETMAAYLSALRSQSASEGRAILAPGDREWAAEDERRLHGIPIDPSTRRSLDVWADDLGIDRLVHRQESAVDDSEAPGFLGTHQDERSSIHGDKRA